MSEEDQRFCLASWPFEGKQTTRLFAGIDILIEIFGSVRDAQLHRILTDIENWIFLPNRHYNDDAIPATNVDLLSFNNFRGISTHPSQVLSLSLDLTSGCPV